MELISSFIYPFLMVILSRSSHIVIQQVNEDRNPFQFTKWLKQKFAES